MLIGSNGDIKRIKIDTNATQIFDKDGKEIFKDKEIFNESVKNTLQNFSFTPAKKKGKPCEFWITIPIKFRLK